MLWPPNAVSILPSNETSQMYALKKRADHRRPDRIAQPTTGRKHHILCVDDDCDLTRIIKARLLRMSVDVSRASSGKEGLKLAHSHRPDAVITDLGMSQGDGEFLLRRLKSKSSTANIPVIVISGLSSANRISEIERQGAAAVLKKPIQFDQLVAELNVHLGRDEVPTTKGQHPDMPMVRRNGQTFRFDTAAEISGPVLRMK